MNIFDAIFGNPDNTDKSGAGTNGTVDGQNAIVERNGDKVDVYYGGQGGNPLDAGHGHIVTDTNGETTYVREPGQNGDRGPEITNSNKA